MRVGVSDKLDFSRRWCIFLFSVSLFLILLLSVSTFFLQRSLPESSLELVNRLDLTHLSVVPSGQILRDPATQHPGVDMRMVPGIPPADLSSATLFLAVE